MKIWSHWWIAFIVPQLLLFIMTTTATSNIYNEIQAIIGTDAGGRGMKSLIVPGDLESAGKTLGTLKPASHVIVLSGFPCCVSESPPTETDGPPGTFSIARTAAALGHDVTVITDDCNEGKILLGGFLVFGLASRPSRSPTCRTLEKQAHLTLFTVSSFGSNQLCLPPH